MAGVSVSPVHASCCGSGIASVAGWAARNHANTPIPAISIITLKPVHRMIEPAGRLLIRSSGGQLLV